jgi:hypothetical protein
MMTCPECGAKEPFSTVKCDCGYVFPIATRKKEERRLAHKEAEPLAAAARYPALRVLAKIYRVFALFSFVIGAYRVVTDLQVVLAAPGAGDAKATVGFMTIAFDVLATGLAFVTCYAIAEAITLLCEISDRVSKRASAD